jgi:hypothetical protein
MRTAIRSPTQVDATLRPYVDNGAVFVAIKLLPGEDTGDLVPLHLSFPGNAPTIPIVPTAVATQPDLGIVVHVLGEHRAIPLNYRHVQINEAAIDWVSGGANYFDVVAQASDEAGGRAFTTDFAGPHSLGSVRTRQRGPESVITAIAEARTLEAFGTAACGLNFGDPDISRILRSVFQPPGNEDAGHVPRLPGRRGQRAGLGPRRRRRGRALARRGQHTPRRPERAVRRAPYLTRLFTTMSAEEMTEDPTFAFNPDAVPVDNVHQATAQVYQCTAEGYVRLLATSASSPRAAWCSRCTNGEMPDAIRAAGRQTVRQGDEPAAETHRAVPDGR